jgi:HTH-type transcriptional regulator, transcriptional repressor of NAD biosynthesis genes
MQKSRNFKYGKGLVIGKFYPPHRGHKYLIDTAASRCEELTVILCWKPSETIPGHLRASWLQKIHPNVRIMAIEDNKLKDDDSEGWAKFTLEILGFTPDAVFTSESYGDPYAKFMGTVHELVDKERVNVPISATMVRSNPLKYSDFLEPCVRAYFASRIVVVGAESTGSTTLAKDLAKHYRTVWVPEYGRPYSEGRLSLELEKFWNPEEFIAIAKGQNELENSLAERSNGMIICDTDAFATSIWYERYLGSRSPLVESISRKIDHDLYILTGDEIPFVQDGTRDGENIRHWMHQRFIERLEEDSKPYIIVRGSPEERLQAAVKAIDQLFSRS